MAKVADVFLNGTIGNVVFYRRMGTQCARSRALHMAKVPEGILGGFIGRVGPISGYRRNGVNIMRTARSRKDKKITPGRLAQREKLKVCNGFTWAFSGTGFFAKSFPSFGDTEMKARLEKLIERK
jgi:hypothetical protein